MEEYLLRNKNMFDFTDYFARCKEAVTDEALFKVFRQDWTFYDMYEHATYDQALVYLEEIRKVPEVYNKIERFILNDNVGHPKLSHFKDLGLFFAPTTLRYVKVLADLVKHFGSLDGFNIVEVGGGYGGQARVIHEMFKVGSYTLVDHPDVVPLAQKYLNEFDIRLHGNKGPYDLFISNYAFTEISRGYQDAYRERFINNSSRGYITCNFYEWYETENMLTFSELINMVPGTQVHEEIPLTAKDNFILTWNLLPR
jgi:hypothetical protein